MRDKFISGKRLYPPLTSGGLWRTWCLLLSAGVRHHPPEAFGGAKFSCKKNLNDIRHPNTKGEDSIVIYGGLRKKIKGLEKKNYKKFKFLVDAHQLYCYTVSYDNRADKKTNRNLWQKPIPNKQGDRH